MVGYHFIKASFSCLTFESCWMYSRCSTADHPPVWPVCYLLFMYDGVMSYVILLRHQYLNRAVLTILTNMSQCKELTHLRTCTICMHPPYSMTHLTFLVATLEAAAWLAPPTPMRTLVTVAALHAHICCLAGPLKASAQCHATQPGGA